MNARQIFTRTLFISSSVGSLLFFKWNTNTRITKFTRCLTFINKCKTIQVIDASFFIEGMKDGTGEADSLMSHITVQYVFD